MENTEIIQKARAKAEMWLNDAYDKATRTEVEPDRIDRLILQRSGIRYRWVTRNYGCGEQPDEYLYGRCRYPRFRQLY